LTGPETEERPFLRIDDLEMEELFHGCQFNDVDEFAFVNLIRPHHNRLTVVLRRFVHEWVEIDVNLGQF
jgi:hypothetical protein